MFKATLFKCHQKTIILLLLGFGLLGNTWAENYPCNANDSEKIQTSIIAFIENDSKGASKGAVISSLRCLSSYASVVVHYAQPNFDDQVGYLQKINDQWNVLGLATGFDDEIMSKIPESLQQ